MFRVQTESTISMNLSISSIMLVLYLFIYIFKDKIVHVHWHDNHGTRDEHLPEGSGLIDHQKALKALKNINYDRTITLEVFTNGNDARSSAYKLKTMWSEDLQQ